jgi:hypothetical protein
MSPFSGYSLRAYPFPKRSEPPSAVCPALQALGCQPPSSTWHPPTLRTTARTGAILLRADRVQSNLLELPDHSFLIHSPSVIRWFCQPRAPASRSCGRQTQHPSVGGDHANFLTDILVELVGHSKYCLARACATYAATRPFPNSVWMLYVLSYTGAVASPRRSFQRYTDFSPPKPSLLRTNQHSTKQTSPSIERPSAPTTVLCAHLQLEDGRGLCFPSHPGEHLRAPSADYQRAVQCRHQVRIALTHDYATDGAACPFAFLSSRGQVYYPLRGDATSTGDASVDAERYPVALGNRLAPFQATDVQAPCES